MNNNSNSPHPSLRGTKQPNSIRKIFLIGMPAAGKTYWGEKIAHEYKLPFIDLDIFIAGQEKASVPALFAQYGEIGFREKEHKYLQKLIETTDSEIIACGGGTPCYIDNMSLMKEAGTVIYLKADVASLMNNINKSHEVRPLLKGRGDIAIYLKELLQKRKSFYEQAHFILEDKEISLLTFGEIISSCINQH